MTDKASPVKSGGVCRGQRTVSPRWRHAVLLACLLGSFSEQATGEALPGPFSVPLKRQRIPLHSHDGIVQHKSAYYGEITAGAPQAQKFVVVFDTGSGHLVLPSTLCRSETCLAHQRYKRRASLLAEDIDVDGAVVKAGEMRDQITVSFGTGEVTGVFVRDRVCLGAPKAPEASKSAPGASLLQVGRIQTTNASSAVEEGADAAVPPLSESDAALLAAAAAGNVPKSGPALAAGRAAARAHLRRKPGGGCVDLRLVAATEMSQDPFSSFAFDGVLGLGLAGLSQADAFNFVDTAAQAGAWNAMGGADRTFAVFLAISEEEQSEITFGGWKAEHLHDGDNFAWSNVRNPELGYWQLDIKSVTANGVKTSFCRKGCRAVVDTGTSLLAVPTPLGKELTKALKHPAAAGGGCATQGPKLEIDLGGFVLSLDPSDYARPELVGSAAKFDEALQKAQKGNTADADKAGSSGVCVPMLMHIDLPDPLGPKTMILGEPILQRYYTAFDAGAKRIGFAKARRGGLVDGDRQSAIFT